MAPNDHPARAGPAGAAGGAPGRRATSYEDRSHDGFSLWCLRGAVDGEERLFRLALGELRVGSSVDSDLRFATPGVSREHALLKVTPRAVVVEARGSNRTFVDGAAVQRAAVADGNELRIGPVALRLEALAPGDVELAIRFDPSKDRPEPPESSSTPLGEESPFVPAPPEAPVPAQWLSHVAAFGRALVADGGGPGAALEELVARLGVVGAGVVEWGDGGAPLAIAARGRWGEIPPRSSFRADGSGRLAVVEDRARGCTGALVADGDRALGLVIWGELAGGEESTTPLLTALLALLEGYRYPAVDAGSEDVPPLSFPEGYVAGRSPAMQQLHRQLARLARRSESVLLVGETGVGKERLARLLHDASPRRDGPWVAVNCAAIPDDLLEAEMFGIEKNVATGVDRRPGKFREADGGTLLLDEVGEMPAALQAKLLRALQDGEVQPVGGRPLAVDVRVVAATNADLESRMREGRFRRDLYYRVAAWRLRVPPLRERRSDLPEFIESFICSQGAAAGVRPAGVTVKALGHLLAYPWPGNVRELDHEIRHLIDLCHNGAPIDSTMLSPHVAATEPGDTPTAEIDLDREVAALEGRLIRDALARSGGQLASAAELLGISRFRLSRKIERLGLRRSQGE